MTASESNYVFTFAVSVERDPDVNSSLEACRYELNRAIDKLAVDPGDYLCIVTADEVDIDWDSEVQKRISERMHS